MRAGRTFQATDVADGAVVVVINETAARSLFGGGDPVGRKLPLTIGTTPEVVGVVGDVLQGRPDGGVLPEVYLSERQAAEADGTLIVRTRGEPLDAAAAIRAAVREVDPTVVVGRTRTLEAARRRGVGDTRVLLLLLGLFAAVAVALAGAGVWAVVAIDVAERRPELGLRLALGAHAGQVIALVMRQGVAAALAGAAAGGWAAWSLAHLLSSLLFDTAAHDPTVFAGAAAALLLGTLIACLLPARQATRVDPARTLRGE